MSREWAIHYNGKEPSSDDLPQAMVVDANGFAYVTGYSHSFVTGNYDCATVKYSPSGQQMWVAVYDGPAHGLDAASDVAVDAAGNVYITGYSYTTPSSLDYVTIKYSPSGQQLWLATYNGPGDKGDGATNLKLDAVGNVYVTGTTTTSSGQVNYATVKYSASGQQQWAAFYDGPANLADQPVDLALDAAGNVYVTGTSANGSTRDDYATVKYSPSGQQLWAARYDGPSSGNDQAVELALDGAANVYVTGISDTPVGGQEDYATLKYNSNGQQLWVARFNGQGNGSDRVTGLAVDANGNAYVTGGSDFHYATLKYSSSGQQQWLATYVGSMYSSDRASDIAVDPTGSVYVTGATYGGGPTGEYATLKYSPDGQQIWAATYPEPAGGIYKATNLALDARNNVYVTGYSGSIIKSISDYATVKYIQPQKGIIYPVVVPPSPISVTAPANQCGARVEFEAVAIGSPVPTITYATSAGPITSPYVFPVGITTVTATATSGVGTSSATFTVNVTDVTPPTIVARNLTVALFNGSATISPLDADAGSTDACGIGRMQLSQTNFSCENLGVNNLTLTVFDVNGNSSTAPITVTVIGNPPAPQIAVQPIGGTYTGGVPTTLYLGYGPQSVTLSASGGTSYSWSPAAGLSNPTSATPVFTATAPGTYTYSLTATGASGCQATTSVTLTVVDARCGNGKKNDKVLVCHNGQELCIAASAVAAHLQHHSGDQLGHCSSQPSLSAMTTELTAYPNPSTERAVVSFQATSSGQAELVVYNEVGQRVTTLFNGQVEAGQQYELPLDSRNLPRGLYLCRLVLGAQTKQVRLSVGK
ncbi:SBBP repeat-containing protein [Hymenobacter wooponensis]|uniref:SBBP repeat-containing protein n=1 Tax=Hymenobacter wooponensis TaxID=1525360 RepID=UPI001436BEF2|nr:SBBP repeat-containing protein [Hymenobacter wooponensis]